MNTKVKNQVVGLCFAALFTALLALLSQFSIMTPIGLPLTFQIFAICLCGYTLQLKWASLSVITYISLGLLGLPIFSGFKGGIGVLFEATGGYIIGFLPLVIICALPTKRKGVFKIILGVSGVLFCHVIGTAFLVQLTHINFVTAFITSSLPFILKDIILCVLAYFLSQRLRKYLK